MAFQRILSTLDRMKYALIVLVGIGLIASFGFLVYRHYKLQREYAVTKPVSSQASLGIDTDEAKRVIDEVRALVVVPTGEEPTVARITDVNRLSGQQFFAQAQNGDHVLVYQNAKRAILFRESENKIVEVTTVNIAGTPTPEPVVAGAEATPSPELTPVVTTPITRHTVFLLNGLGDQGSLSAFRQRIEQQTPELQVVGEATGKKTYEKTLFVDIAGDKESEANDYSQRLNIGISTYPEGEDRYSSDFLIVVGLDNT
jgi:hypothetical protein